MILARQRYADTINALASSYASAARDAEFTSKRFGHHPDVFKTAVRPFIDQGLKTAYFLVDALRYEMACELIEGFSADYENRIDVLGQLPGITSVGMAALLPGADMGLSPRKKARASPSPSPTMLFQHARPGWPGFRKRLVCRSQPSSSRW